MRLTLYFFLYFNSCNKVRSNIGEPVPQVSSTRGEFSDPVYKEIALANGHINRMNKDELRSKLAECKLDTRYVGTLVSAGDCYKRNPLKIRISTLGNPRAA